jgi:hypothetical protein
MTSFTGGNFKRFKKLPVTGIPIRILAIRFFQLYREKIQKTEFTDHAIYVPPGEVPEGRPGREGGPGRGEVPGREGGPGEGRSLLERMRGLNWRRGLVPHREGSPIRRTPSDYTTMKTHLLTMPFILKMIRSSGKSMSKFLKKDLDEYGVKTGVSDKSSPIFKIFLDKHRAEEYFIPEKLLNELSKLTPHTQEEEDEIIKQKLNSDFSKKFRTFFNELYKNFKKKFTTQNQAERIFLTFIYDFMLGYISTYGIDGYLDINKDIPIYYNNYFKYFIGKKALDLIKDKIIPTDEEISDDQIIESIINYANGDIPTFLQKPSRYVKGGSLEESDEDADPLEVYNHDFINLDEIE